MHYYDEALLFSDADLHGRPYRLASLFVIIEDHSVEVLASGEFRSIDVASKLRSGDFCLVADFKVIK